MEGEEVVIPDCVPARIVNEYVYCHRLAYLEWVQGEFEESADVVEGRYQHRHVDKAKGDLDESQDDEKIHITSLWLSSTDERLSAKLDLLEKSERGYIPVDYKHGALPDIPGQVWDTDRVQLCAQALVLRSNGYPCEVGVVYYVASKTRVEVPIDPNLVAKTRQVVQDIIDMAESGNIPRPLADSPKCPRCSLAGICLPDEVTCLTAPEEVSRGDADELRRILPARDDALPLHVTGYASKVSKSGELLKIYNPDGESGEVRLNEVSCINLYGSVQVTSQVLTECFSRGIPVAYFTMGGWFHGIAHGMAHKNIELRLAQYRAYEDVQKRLDCARLFVAAKILNGRTLILRNHGGDIREVLRVMARMAGQARRTRELASLLGVEGTAARAYFQSFSGMLKAQDEHGQWAFDFTGRNRRPPRDPVNAMLSYVYALLVKDLTVTLLAAGFDPYLGMYHQPRYGRPALALDLMEEFRPVIADSTVLSAINNRIVTPADFQRRGTAVGMTPEGKKKLLRAYERRMDVLVTHPVFGYRISYRRVLDVQARLLGRFFLGEIPKYPSFRIR